ncbi:MAG TPA: isoprenylcysteine carboxylmethyltransferase family protein [Candidatus Udaeobacter sp.]|nr:isoprenylcysteine carboxylmethyltransferase family protein [Candidatus Udaeobacter sp.]
MTSASFIVVLVALARGLELLHARRNERRLLAEGATEVGRAHYPLIVGLHLAWLIVLGVAAPSVVALRWPWLALFLLLQPARLWILASLGRFWTTRVITLSAQPLIRRGPYRLVRHPNYLIVELEIVSLPLAFGLDGVALLFGLANAALLLWRIRVEDRALDPRRDAMPTQG